MDDAMEILANIIGMFHLSSAIVVGLLIFAGLASILVFLKVFEADFFGPE
jgi:hypothetical protein